VSAVKTAERTEARRLRTEGYSIKEICQRLQVSKGTVSVWVRDIRLNAEQVKRLDEKQRLVRERFGYLNRCGDAHKNRAEALVRHKAFREAGFERARRDATFRVICALYWGEGQKSNGMFGVCNSDPTLLNVILQWLLKEGYDEALAFSVRYHLGNGLAENEIRHWWLEQLPLLRAHHLRKFGVCTVHRASQLKKVGKLPYGTASLRVCRVELLHTVMGGIEFLRSSGDW
jgi:hypothetical protein